MTKRYTKAVAKLVAARAELEAARIEMQLECKHERVAEYPCVADNYGTNHTPPYRVCADCGFAEYGWDCGYQILRAEPTLPKAERVGPIHKNGRFVRVGNILDKRRLYEAAVRGERLAEEDR